MRRLGAISGLRARLLPMNRLRLVAPTNVLDAASRVTMALNATALYTTEPVAQQVARKAAGEELTKFTNIFRAEGGKDQYTDAAQREAALKHILASPVAPTKGVSTPCKTPQQPGLRDCLSPGGNL